MPGLQRTAQIYWHYSLSDLLERKQDPEDDTRMMTVIALAIISAAGFLVGRELGLLQKEDRIRVLEAEVKWWRDLYERTRKNLAKIEKPSEPGVEG